MIYLSSDAGVWWGGSLRYGDERCDDGRVVDKRLRQTEARTHDKEALCGLPVPLMGIAYRRLRCVILAVLIQRSSERTGVYHIRFIVAHRWAGNVLSF